MQSRHALTRTCSALAVVALCGLMGRVAAAAPAEPMNSDAVRAHIDEAEDLVDMLLSWRHAITATGSGRESPDPVNPATTLITIHQDDATKLTAAVNALATFVSKASPGQPMRRGDLRAHVEKAQEIVHELAPASPTAVGTSGSGTLVTIDRTTLERLAVELDAMEPLVRRAVK